MKMVVSMKFYEKIKNANQKAFKEKLKVIAQREKKSYLKMLLDTYYSVLKYGIGLTDYLNYEFYKKDKNKLLKLKKYKKVKICKILISLFKNYSLDDIIKTIK